MELETRVKSARCARKISARGQFTLFYFGNVTTGMAATESGLPLEAAFCKALRKAGK
jgi:hypothetical protein